MSTATEITKGTEKQIKWARDIQAKWVERIDERVDSSIRRARAAGLGDEIIAKLEATRALAVATACASDDARDYIEFEQGGDFFNATEAVNTAARIVAASGK